jgi:2-dehydro-3-deoxyphosphooctonate aldolase (KDO 8-P synthase)
MNNKVIRVKKINIGNKLPLTLIAGPCQIESKDHCHMIASKIKKIADKLNIGFIFKSSFDKANRTSIKSARGIGLDKSLSIFEYIAKDLDLPILTDVHNEEQCEIVSKVVDVIQIPAFLCRQTDLLVAAAKTNKVINIKKGQFLAPWDMKNVIKKIEESGNNKILITERGVSFGYNTLISDMRSLPILSELGYPVVYDATHSVQQPGGKGDSSGGERQFVSSLSRAAVAVGISTIFIETHNNPDKAPSDGANMIPLNSLEKLLKNLIAIDKIIKSN